MAVNSAAAPFVETALATGVEALDDVSCGGRTASPLHLTAGRPGTGKTTLALQFLCADSNFGEHCLYIPLSESRDEPRAAAAGHDLSRDGTALLPRRVLEQIDPAEFRPAGAIRGVLTGVPNFVGQTESLLDKPADG